MRNYKSMSFLLIETVLTVFAMLFLVLWMLFYVAFPFFLYPILNYSYSYAVVNAPFIAMVSFIIFSQICYYLRQSQEYFKPLLFF